MASAPLTPAAPPGVLPPGLILDDFLEEPHPQSPPQSCVPSPLAPSAPPGASPPGLILDDFLEDPLPSPHPHRHSCVSSSSPRAARPALTHAPPIPSSVPTPVHVSSPTFPSSPLTLSSSPSPIRPPPLTACPRRSTLHYSTLLRPKPRKAPPAPRSSCRSPCPFTDRPSENAKTEKQSTFLVRHPSLSLNHHQHQQRKLRFLPIPPVQINVPHGAAHTALSALKAKRSAPFTKRKCDDSSSLPLADDNAMKSSSSLPISPIQQHTAPSESELHTPQSSSVSPAHSNASLQSTDASNSLSNIMSSSPSSSSSPSPQKSRENSTCVASGLNFDVAIEHSVDSKHPEAKRSYNEAQSQQQQTKPSVEYPTTSTNTTSTHVLKVTPLLATSTLSSNSNSCDDDTHGSSGSAFSGDEPVKMTDSAVATETKLPLDACQHPAPSSSTKNSVSFPLNFQSSADYPADDSNPNTAETVARQARRNTEPLCNNPPDTPRHISVTAPPSSSNTSSLSSETTLGKSSKTRSRDLDPHPKRQPPTRSLGGLFSKFPKLGRSRFALSAHTHDNGGVSTLRSLSNDLPPHLVNSDPASAIGIAVHNRAPLYVLLDLYALVEQRSNDRASTVMHSARRAATSIHGYLLGNGTIAEAAMRTLLLVNVPTIYSTLDSHMLNLHRATLATLLTHPATAPLPSIILRRPRARGTLLSFLPTVSFPASLQTGQDHDPDLVWRTSVALALLNNALRQQPQQTASLLATRSSLLNAFTADLIVAPGAADLLTRLVAADALDDDDGMLASVGSGSSTSSSGVDFLNDGGGNGGKSSANHPSDQRNPLSSSATSSSSSSAFPAVGAANPGGILALGKASVLASLVRTFVSACDSLLRLSCQSQFINMNNPSSMLSMTPFHQFSPTRALQNPDPRHCTCTSSSNTATLLSSSLSISSSLPWTLVSVAARTIAEVCVRSLLVPPFSRANCSFAPRATRALNAAHASLSLFANVVHVRALLDAALPSTSRPCMFVGHCAWAALSCVSNVLRVVRFAAHPNASAALRRLLRTPNNTSARVEAELIQVLPRIIALLSMPPHQRVARAKLAACELLTALSASPHSATRGGLIASDVVHALVSAGTMSIESDHGGDDCADGFLQESSARERGRGGNRTRRNNGLTPFHMAIVECARVSAAALAGEADAACANKRDSRDRTERDVNVDINLVVIWARAIVSIVQTNRQRQDEVVADFAIQITSAVAQIWPKVKKSGHRTMTAEEIDVMDVAVTQAFDKERSLRGLVPCGGPKPVDGPKVCLLASAKSLASRLDDFDAV